MKPHLIRTLLLLLTIAACKKEKVLPEPVEPEKLTTDIIAGRPEHPDKINGYFLSLRYITGYTSPHIEAMDLAIFSEQPGDLGAAAFRDKDIEQYDIGAIAGDLNVGRVTLNGRRLDSNFKTGPRYYYEGKNNSVDLSTNKASWAYAGTGQIPADTFNFNKPYPVYSTTISAWPLQPDSSLMIPVDSVFDNFSEGFLTLIYNTYRGSGYVSRTTFKDARGYFYQPKSAVRQLFAMGGGGEPCTMDVHGFNYFYKYHNGKLYLFVFGATILLSAK
jgi:hypothetical protein